MRTCQTVFILVASAALGATASAQSTQERCAALEADTIVAWREHQAQVAKFDRLAAAYDAAVDRRDAVEAKVSHPMLVVLLGEEAFTENGMLRFREQHALPSEVAEPLDPAVFWGKAAAQLLNDTRRAVELEGELLKRLKATRDAYKNFRCQARAIDPLGQLPVERRPDGQPIVTDALITRWVKARYALANSGGAYWQAGQMSQQDYFAVDGRMRRYLDLRYSGRPDEEFSDNEIRAIRGRSTDIENTIQGNWSRIQFE